MNALLLAAGFGTRLRPLTLHTPKCLVRVGVTPLLDIWLARLSAAGFDNFLINTHHLAHKVQEHVAAHPLRQRVRLVHELELLGTAGTIRANKEFCLSGTTLVAHADNLCLCDWNSFLHAHQTRPEGTLMTMMTFQTPTPETCGIVQLDGRGLVQCFFEKRPDAPGNLANAAIYLLEPQAVEFILSLSPPVSDISTEVLPLLLGRMLAWHNHGVLVDIGTPASLENASAAHGEAAGVAAQLPESVVHSLQLKA